MLTQEQVALLIPVVALVGAVLGGTVAHYLSEKAKGAWGNYKQWRNTKALIKKGLLCTGGYLTTVANSYGVKRFNGYIAKTDKQVRDEISKVVQGMNWVDMQIQQRVYSKLTEPPKDRRHPTVHIVDEGIHTGITFGELEAAQTIGIHDEVYLANSDAIAKELSDYYNKPTDDLPPGLLDWVNGGQ